MARLLDRDLLSFGAVLIILVISIMLGVSGLISWGWIPPLFIAMCGFWMFAIAGMQAANPRKYARSAFSLAALGVFVIALSCAWFVYNINWIYSVVIVLLACAMLVIATALKRK